MEFALVDIETTGGYPRDHHMVELYVAIHDGTRVLQTYHSMVKPLSPLPGRIQQLTGIQPEELENAPLFSDIAEEVFGLLKDRVLVAHQASFDYSFLKKELTEAGYPLDLSRICTVRLSRKMLPGYSSYSLGSVCGRLGIAIEGRHRAEGDARALVQLFEHLYQLDSGQTVQQMLKKKSGMQFPAHLDPEKIHGLPETPGVYRFLARDQKPLYIGMAVNLKKRVYSHFGSIHRGRRKQQMHREVFDVVYRECGTPWLAALQEASDIATFFPPLNKALKFRDAVTGLVKYENHAGHICFTAIRNSIGNTALRYFYFENEVHLFLRKLSELTDAEYNGRYLKCTEEQAIRAEQYIAEENRKWLLAYEFHEGRYWYAVADHSKNLRIGKSEIHPEELLPEALMQQSEVLRCGSYAMSLLRSLVDRPEVSLTFLDRGGAWSAAD